MNGAQPRSFGKVSSKPLSSWLAGTARLPQRFLDPTHIDRAPEKWMAFVGMEERIPLHQASAVEWKSLSECHGDTQAYVSNTRRILGEFFEPWLDHEARYDALASLGDPPAPCTPIYMISVGRSSTEEIVYVGQTATKNRFVGGHAVALKLHAPEYDGIAKWLYRCTVWFLIEDDFIPLEWLTPIEFALSTLKDIEANLVFDLQPCLNAQLKKELLARRPLDSIHLQNLTGSKVSDRFMYPVVKGK